MPGFCTPWPGKSRAIGPDRSITRSSVSRPFQQGGAPGQARTEPCQKDVVSSLHAALADRLFKRDRDGCARGVAVLVDVDRDPLDRKPVASRGGVDDAVVRLVRNPQI